MCFHRGTTKLSPRRKLECEVAYDSFLGLTEPDEEVLMMMKRRMIKMVMIMITVVIIMTIMIPSSA